MSMSRSKSSILALAPIFIGMCAAFPALAATPIDQTRPLDPRGRVEIDNLKGRVEVRAWDRPEVKITGSLGAGVEKLSVEGDRGALHIEVKYPNRANNTEPTVLVVQVPLYLTNHVAALGVTRLLMGIPFWALAIWVSYLIIATPMHRHKVAAKKIQTEVAVDAELEPSATGKDDDAS